MTKKLFINFVKDKLALFVIYFANSLLLIVFFKLSVSSKIEILYPLCISVFLFLILFFIEWFKYKTFNESLIKSASNPYISIKSSTNEQAAVCSVLDTIHSNYSNIIDGLNSDLQNKRRFLSQWVHCMKTPISVIDLIIQKNSSENTDIKEALMNIQSENYKLSSSLDQALSYMRIDEFSKDYEPQTVDLAASIKNIINNRKSQFIYNNVFPKVNNSSNEIIPVLTDSKWNEVMIDQFISNAIKYSFSGNEAKNIYIEIYKKDSNVILSIKDEGIGIPPYDMNRIFEPFFTGENGRKSRNSTGIGLYICSVIAEKLGHKINIESQEGHGTTVTISYLSKL